MEASILVKVMEVKFALLGEIQDKMERGYIMFYDHLNLI